jgi:hypothetical protein
MIDNVQDLLTHLTTIDAAAERKFNAYSRDMVRMRTDEIRRHIANNKPLDYIYSAVIDMRGWAAAGSLQSITWLDRQLERLAQNLEPASMALVNAHVAALITEGLTEANR